MTLFLLIVLMLGIILIGKISHPGWKTALEILLVIALLALLMIGFGLFHPNPGPVFKLD